MLTISTKIRYGIRAMLQIIECEHNNPVPLSEIAEKQSISYKYLENIFKMLKKADLIQSSRGPEGGYKLTRSPDDITIYQIIEAIDGPISIVDCIKDTSLCNRIENCNTRAFWYDFLLHVTGYLKAKNLSDLK